jgi:hypothetical protein
MKLAKHNTGVRKQSCKRTIGKAFLAAYLLTASTERAETAVMEAIVAWDPKDENEDTLFRRVLDAAVHDRSSGVAPRVNTGDPAETSLPPELQGVLSLSSQLRRCLVLRTLVGLSRQACAGMLDLNGRRVDRYTTGALERLANPRPQSTRDSRCSA